MTFDDRLGLDRTQVDLLRLLSQGCSIDRVALELGLSARTVKRRVKAIRTTLGASTTIQAVAIAVRHGLL